MDKSTIERLKNSYCLGLRADIGLGLASNAFETLLYPSNELLKGYKGLVFIAIAPSENDMEIQKCRNGLDDLGINREFALVDAIVGYAELDSVFEYDSDRALQADAEQHGYDGTIAELRVAMQCDRIFGYHFANRCLCKEFVLDVGGAIGRAWQAIDPQDAYHFRKAYSSEVVA